MRQSYTKTFIVSSFCFRDCTLNILSHCFFEQIDKVNYIKIHAPFEILCQKAEEMRVKIPTAENDIDIRLWYQDISYYRYLSDRNPFRIKNSTIEKKKEYFVATFIMKDLKNLQIIITLKNSFAAQREVD